MNRKRALLIILILFTGLFPLIPIPIAKATEATVSIQNSEDDVWMTESGNIFGYESSIRILEPEIGIRSFLRFEDVPLLKSSKINYATLYVYAGFDQGETISPGAMVTIYGIDEPDCAPFSYSGRVWSLERPYTSASVNWNVSDWHYSTWKSVNVTSIVREIVNQYAWVQNNSIGFQILGATDSGYEYRTFEDIDHQHHGAYAYLYFQYDTPPGGPPGLPDTAVWEETYGEFDIWSVPGGTIDGGYPLEPLDYVFTNGTAPSNQVVYETIHLLPETPVSIITTQSDYATGLTGTRHLVRADNGTIYVTYAKAVPSPFESWVKRSDDNGTTWIGETQISIAPMTEGAYPSIAIDSNDNLHVTLRGAPPVFHAIYYLNYTDSWSAPIKISTGAITAAQGEPMIAVDSQDNLYITWHGDADGLALDPVWINIRNETGWGYPVQLSTYPGMNASLCFTSTIAVDNQDNVHVIFISRVTGNDQVWYTKYENDEWSTPIKINTNPPNTIGQKPSMSIDSQDNIHVVWTGRGTDFGVYDQVWYGKYNGSWQTSVRISTYPGMNVSIQENSNIGMDSSDNLHVLWYGQATGTNKSIWYVNYTDSWSEPYNIQPKNEKNNWPNLRWSMWPQRALTNDTFYVVDENNTVIETWNGDNFTDINDLKDYIDDYVDPEGGDPLDPDPGTQGWDIEGPFTRFNMRLYFLIIGLGCVFGPVWAMAYKKFDSVGYAWCFIVIVLGVGLLWSITGI